MDIEQQIVAAGATKGPRITPADVEANIVSEHYFTAADGVRGEGGTNLDGDWAKDAPEALGLLTICVLVLRNGFTVTGESACASPENFKADIGKRIARENAVNKIYPLMGYELRSKLAAIPADFRDRVRAEHAKLVDDNNKLNAFIVSHGFTVLGPVDQTLLRKQADTQRQLINILATRIAGF